MQIQTIISVSTVEQLNLFWRRAIIVYALLLSFLRRGLETGGSGVAEEQIKNAVFIASLPWFIGYFLICLVVLLFFWGRYLRREPGD